MKTATTPIIESEEFSDAADRWWSEEELNSLKLTLSRNPEKGNLVQRTGGCRKVRWGVKSKGKGTRGGARVIYYYQDPEQPLFLVMLYIKDEKADLNAADKKKLRELTKMFRDE